MKEKHIGIIIQNQDDKILLYDDTYYIKVEIHENDNINNVIANIKKRNVKVIEKLLFIPLKNLLFPKFFSINFTGILRIKAMAIPHIKGFSIPKNL